MLDKERQNCLIALLNGNPFRFTRGNLDYAGFEKVSCISELPHCSDRNFHSMIIIAENHLIEFSLIYGEKNGQHINYEGHSRSIDLERKRLTEISRVGSLSHRIGKKEQFIVTSSQVSEGLVYRTTVKEAPLQLSLFN